MPALITHTPMLKASKCVQKPTAKAADRAASSVAPSVSEQPPTSKQAPKAHWIYWNGARMEWLLDWLEENPEDRQKLFSNSSKNAKEEGWCKHVVTGTKSEFHKMIATFVFSVDNNPNVCMDFCSNPVNYMKSIDNYIIWWVFHLYPCYVWWHFLYRLQKEYRFFNEKLEQTGAGLQYEDLEEGSNLQNLVGEYDMSFTFCHHCQLCYDLEQLKQDFPYWKCLNSFWCTLPNFNPYTASLEPGQEYWDHANGDNPDTEELAGNVKSPLLSFTFTHF